MKSANLLRWVKFAQPEGYDIVTKHAFWRPLNWKDRNRPVRELAFNARLITASVCTSALLSAALYGGVARVQHATQWSKVFANGSYVGLVPNRDDITKSMARMAIGYHVNVSMAPVHTNVSSQYDWRKVASLPTPAIALEAGGKPLVYTASVQAADAVLSQIRRALMPKTTADNAIATFSKPVQLVRATVGIANIWSTAASVEHILHPQLSEPAGRAITLNAMVEIPATGAGTASTRRLLPGETGLSAAPSAAAVASSKNSSLATNHPLLSLRVNEMVDRSVAIPAPVQYEKTDTLGVGTEKVIRAGRPGRARERLAVEFMNGTLTASAVVQRRVLSSPVAEVVEQGTNAGVASGSWSWPSPDTDITSPFGWRILGGVQNFHPGVDIGCPIGTPVYATNDGVVEQAGWNDGGYGNWALINNGNGIETVFGHMSKVLVSPGETVTKGQEIGLSGDTGFATGPHLHYEVRLNGTAVNPTPYM